VLIVAATLGLGAGFAAYNMVEPEYAVSGSFWVNREQGDSELSGPIRQGELMNSAAWLELMRTFEVLEPVVMEERLYLRPGAHRRDDPIFANLIMTGELVPGSYLLSVSEDGSRWTLTAGEETVLDRGSPGEPVGRDLGISWTPPASALPPGREVDFRLIMPRTAAQNLSSRISTEVRQETFLHLELTGQDPEWITRVLTRVMHQQEIAATELKRGKLDELTRILETQLAQVETELSEAESELEGFKVRTITLPQEESSPVAPGIEETRGTVFGDFFARRVELETLQQDLAQLRAALQLAQDGTVQVEAYEMIPALEGSSQLSQALAELTTARAELRTLLEQYTPAYGPVQDLQDRIATLEEETIPSLTRSLITQLQAREDRLESLLASREQELAQIPSRSLQEANLERRVATADDLYRDLRNRLETARLAAASSIPDIEILDEPQVPRSPARDPRVQYAGMAFLGLLGLGVAGVILVDRFDPRIRYPVQVSEDLGVEILGAIPRIKVRKKTNAEQVQEAFREIRMRVEFAYGSAKPLILAVTSPDASEGKTLVAANLGIAFSQLRRRTLLIDADTRRGDIHELLELDRKPGLTDSLAGAGQGSLIQESGYSDLYFMGSGSRQTASPELLGQSRMQDLMASAKQRFDVIILDCPPMAAGGDAFVLGAHAGSVLLVLRSGSTRRDLAQAKMEAFYRLPVRILGAVLNDVEPNASYGAYGYRSYYLPGYRASDEAEAEAVPV
jgi:capsular exopolysaccharide synthesis family protein